MFLARTDPPQVELGNIVSQQRDTENVMPPTSSSLPSRMYPSARPDCPGRLEMMAYSRPAPN